MSAATRSRPRPRVVQLHLKAPCRASGKRRFETEIDVLLEHATNPRRIRAYQCDHCQKWHAATVR